MQTDSVFQYGLVYRPAGIGAVPPGFAKIDDATGPLKQIARHGIITYPRQLTDAEIKGYELLPLLSATEVADLALAVSHKLARYASAYLEQAEDDPECFRGRVHEAMMKICGYRVHTGCHDAFVAQVVSHLKAACRPAN